MCVYVYMYRETERERERDSSVASPKAARRRRVVRAAEEAFHRMPK